MIQVGQTIGNYKITAKLGEGGMGVVYLAEHPVIGRKVALKAIHPELSRNPEVVSRFMTEAKSVNQIGNEHIVDVSDFGNTPEGEFYFIMEFLQGEALADRLRREKVFETARALNISGQVADALAASHGHGIVHRDLKPENIFLINRSSSHDFVKVLDFGLAKLTQGEEKVTHKTRTGSVMGTPYYMAPEQCEGKPNIDHRADIYSLGVILFEMMTGKVPFGGEGYGEIIVKHITMPPPSPRAINPAVTVAHEAVILRALAKRREERFQSMEEFRTALSDPDRYAASAPALTGMAPAGYDDGSGSGRMHLGTRSPTSMELGANAGAMPSTFRHGTGELLDEELSATKSRKPLVFGAIGAAVLAGAAAVFFMQGKTEDPPATPPAVVAATQPPPGPAVNDKVKISFTSTPEGAEVFNNESGVRLGKTPFSMETANDQGKLTFVFKLEGRESVEVQLDPKGMQTALVPATLPARPPAPTPVAVEKPEPRTPQPTKARKPASNKPKKPAGSPTKPLDEDGVLEPSFK